MYFSTSAYEPAARRDAWRTAIDSRCGPFETSFKTAAFEGSIDARRVAGLDCARLSQSAYRARRTHREVEQGRQADYFVILQTAGSSILEQADRTATLGPGDITIIDSARPSTFHFPIRSTQLSLHVSRQVLECTDSRWDARVATLLPKAAAELVGALLRTSFEHSHGFAGDQNDAIRESLVSLMAMGWRDDAAQGARQPAQASDQLREIQNFILLNIEDEGLNPQKIAASQRISERQLHRIFGAAGSTVCRWIRQARLDRCAARLIDPVHRDRSITEIAFEAGFNDAAHFSRLFRSEFAQTPSEFRASRQ